MNVLLIPANYPHSSRPQAGPQNERCARALAHFVDRVVVVTPRPFIPMSFAFNARWKSYTALPSHHISSGIEVYRPTTLVIPRVFQAFWPSDFAYYAIRSCVAQLNQKYHFNAILSFDLMVGGLAWRLGRMLGIPSAGWAVGGDMHHEPTSPNGRRIVQSLQKLDIVFYQSRELLDLGTHLLGINSDQMPDFGQHMVLARGVNEPEVHLDDRERRSVRKELNVSDDEVMVLYLGRIVRNKGVFGLIDIFGKNSQKMGNLKLVFIGARPGFDHSVEFEKHLQQYPELLKRVHLLPACTSEATWRYFEAADVFAFPSHHTEGMPNALLEALISGLPAVAFDIPAIQDITEYDHEALFVVRDFNYEDFFEKILLLRDTVSLRKSMGTRGKILVQKHFSLENNMKLVSSHLKALIR